MPYEEGLKECFGDIEKIMIKNEISSDIMKECENMLSLSCKNITDKWSKGRKYARTLFIIEAYQDEYPIQILETSVLIDAMVNILDDLLDENMSSGEKKLYVLEFLRVFALHNKKVVSKEAQLIIGEYFFQLISLAVVENHFDVTLNKENDFDRLIESSIKVLNCRSMDIDIFHELVFIYRVDYSESERESLKKIARLFRAVNIMKKDVDDMEHDKASGQESLVLKVFNKDDCDFEKYISSVCDHYIKEASIAVDKNKNEKVIFGFSEMLLGEISYIKNKIRAL